MVITLYAGILGLIYVGLSIFVIMGRFQNKVSLGDGGHDEMTRRIRMHANFVEYVPIALLVMIFTEFEGGSEIFLHILGLGLVLARLMHGWGLYNSDASIIFRRGGMILTLAVIIVASLFCIKTYFLF